MVVQVDLTRGQALLQHKNTKGKMVIQVDLTRGGIVGDDNQSFPSKCFNATGRKWSLNLTTFKKILDKVNYSIISIVGVCQIMLV